MGSIPIYSTNIAVQSGTKFVSYTNKMCSTHITATKYLSRSKVGLLSPKQCIWVQVLGQVPIRGVSSMAEQRAVNSKVIGSSPLHPANIPRYSVKYTRQSVKLLPNGWLGELPRLGTRYGEIGEVNNTMHCECIIGGFDSLISHHYLPIDKLVIVTILSRLNLRVQVPLGRPILRYRQIGKVMWL